MQSLIFAAVFSLIPFYAFADGTVECFSIRGFVECYTAVNMADFNASTTAVIDQCSNAHSRSDCSPSTLAHNFRNLCAVVMVNNANSDKRLFLGLKVQASNAIADALSQCVNSSSGNGFNCPRLAMACDGTAVALDAPAKVPATSLSPSISKDAPQHQSWWSLINLTIIGSGIGTGIGIGIGLILVLLIYAARAPIINFIIHGNLLYELPAYGEDIQVIFKRTQRVNWYGRVIFGIVANLSMTKDQLSKVRRYWLGRVIAFDSLRRQRQNELARMHLHLAATVKTDAKEKRALSQLWAFLKVILLSVFYLLRALFSFLFGFLFIRITIAKLARGAVIESKDLVLILQAKMAIEETANYLKEYLTSADTFDGRDEIHNAE